MDSPQVQVVILLDLAFVLGSLCFFLAVLALNRHSAYRALRERALSFSDLYNNINEGVFRSTLDGHMISANPALVRLNGFASEAEMLNEVNDIAGQWYVDPNRRAELHQMLLEKGEVLRVTSEVYRYKTRERIWIEEKHAPRPRSPHRATAVLRRHGPRSHRCGETCRTPGALREDHVARRRLPLPVAPEGPTARCKWSTPAAR